MTDIAPIKDDVSHKAALSEIDRLWGAEEGSPEGDKLDVLMTLVDAFERTHWPVEEINPIEAVKARMENSGRTRKEFEALVGSSGRASEILNRKRHLTLAMIWKLTREWQIPADLLVQPYKLARSKKRPNMRGQKTVQSSRLRAKRA